MVEEERPVRVLPRAAGPLGRATGRLPDAFEASLERRGAQDHLIEGPFHAARLGEVGLVPSCDALREPAGRAGLGKERPRARHSSKQSTRDLADEVIRPVQVHDVRELVRDDQFHPVVVISQGGVADGRTSVDRDAIRWIQLGEAIGDVDVVGHQKVDHPGGCLDELSGELVVGVLRNASGSAPQRLQLSRERHPEVVRFDRTP